MIRVTDVAYARFEAPDLDPMETFLVDFGLIRQHRDDDTLYMRGAGRYDGGRVRRREIRPNRRP